MSDEELKLIKGLYRKPFHYDPYGQMIFDANHNQVLDIRGWGRIQYLDNAELKQDTFGKFIAYTLNECYDTKQLS
jgi:hypothetical protein